MCNVGVMFDVNDVKQVVDITVKETGLPVAGKVLVASNVTTRKALRSLVRKGVLQSLVITTHDGTELIGYYTEDVLPMQVKKWRERHAGGERTGI